MKSGRRAAETCSAVFVCRQAYRTRSVYGSSGVRPREMISARLDGRAMPKGRRYEGACGWRGG